jgi:hypothetical protein
MKLSKEIKRVVSIPKKLIIPVVLLLKILSRHHYLLNYILGWDTPRVQVVVWIRAVKLGQSEWASSNCPIFFGFGP